MDRKHRGRKSRRRFMGKFDPALTAVLTAAVLFVLLFWIFA